MSASKLFMCEYNFYECEYNFYECYIVQFL